MSPVSHLSRLVGFLALFVLMSCNGRGTATTSGPDTTASTQQQVACDEDDGAIQLPNGFCARVVADDLGTARHLAVRDNGDVYVKLRGSGIVALRDTNGDYRADVKRTFADYGGTGIALHGGYLYASSDAAVYRYTLAENELVPQGEREAVVSGFPRQRQHAAKSFAFDESGHLYVNVGAPSNACQKQSRTPGSPGQDPCPLLEEHGGIWRFQADATGQSFRADARFATGIRNAVALDWNPADQTLYAVQHGRDQLHHLWPDRYTQEENAQLPAEEFLRLTEGTDAGWPYCHYDQIQNEKVLAPEYGGSGDEVGRCDQYADPVVAFPGHWAPNDLLFYTGESFPQRYQGGAFIAFHGSWNRAPLEQAGYKVMHVPFEDGQPAADSTVFADDFAGTETLESPGDAAFRPMGLAQGPDGALYISDSQQGRIWRVVHTGSE